MKIPFRNALLLSWLLSLIIFNTAVGQDLVEVQTLHDGWQFAQADKKEWREAKVPGCVHTDLLRHKLIEDPFFGNNEKKVQWIDKKDWVYKTSFEVGAEKLKKRNFEMVFEGLDTYADVFLNGKKILSADNMFRTWDVDVKKNLKAGKNELKIFFHSPIKKAEPLWDALGYPLFAINDDTKTGGTGDKALSVMTRKAGYQYGWDWGPRLVSSGVYRAIKLKQWNIAKIENVRYTQHNLTKKNVDVKGVLTLTASQKKKVTVAVVDAKTGAKYASVTKKVKAGENKVPFSFSIKNPKLWWTNGLGEQHLYGMKLQVLEGDNLIEENTQNIGIRTIRLIAEKDEIGRSFMFRLNGEDVFIKGTNYIPADMFLDRVQDKDLETVIKAAADANMNMIRVWGGGTYERDYFYDLCDKYGILVWQDFMFACSLYPGDAAFINNVKEEVKDNIIRLRNHPSIGLWCGNNEIEWAWFGWGLQKQFNWSEQDSAKIINDYFNLFTKEIPALVKEYDDKDYWASSPSFRAYGDHLENEGDRHLWDVWKGPKSWNYYKEHVPRFMSEYGYQAFPEMATIKNWVNEEDLSLWSKSMRNHQKAKYGNKRIGKNLEREFGVNGKDFSKFVYASLMYQAYDVKFGIETHRRNKPHCMGTMYWQINDCWPVASWASIDYEGRWKAIHYAVRDSYKPVITSISEDDKAFNVFVVSDELKAFEGKLNVKVLDFNGKVLVEKASDIKVAANSSKNFISIKPNEVAGDRTNIVVVAEVSRDGKVLDRNEFFSAKNKDLKLAIDYKLDTKVVKGKDGTYKIVLTTDKVLRGVKVESSDATGTWSDNFFDLLPNEKKVVNWTPASNSSKDIKFSVRTLNDILNKKGKGELGK